MSRKLRTSIAAIAATAAGVALVATPSAGAAGNPYTATGVCGAGFRVVQSQPVDFQRIVAGRSVLTFNAGQKRWCAVTLKSRLIGTASWTDATIQRPGRTQKWDANFFSYFAGPRYVEGGRGACVEYSGSMQLPRRNTTLSAYAKSSVGC